MRTLPFYSVFLLPLTVVVGLHYGGWWTFLTPILAFVIVPMADIMVGTTERNPTHAEEDAVQEAMDYRLPTILAAPTQLAFMLWGAYVVTHWPLTAIEALGFTVSLGVMGGVIGINVAHELVHRQTRYEPALARAMLLSVGYVHWGLEHVAGHHRTVATPEDPATARLGQSFYSFWPQTVIGGWKGAWRIEAARLTRKQQPLWGVHNRLLRWSAAVVALVGALWWTWGFGAVVFYAAQALVAFSLLEAVNYLEHYGLLRAKLPDGTYERTLPVHSWNASERVTNWFLFNLQRHSDHHHKPGRRYQILRHVDEAPQLPTGYAGMVLLALVPPLWFRVMDPMVPEGMKARQQQEHGAAV